MPSRPQRFVLTGVAARGGRVRCAGIGPSGGPSGEEPEGPLRKFVASAERQAHNLIHALTPKQEGDLADVFLIVLSTLIFMWLAAEMYRLYAFQFWLAGDTPGYQGAGSGAFYQ